MSFRNLPALLLTYSDAQGFFRETAPMACKCFAKNVFPFADFWSIYLFLNRYIVIYFQIQMIYTAYSIDFSAMLSMTHFYQKK